MPSIVSFHRNVGHAVILIILFSFFYLATPVCRFIHLLSETTLNGSTLSCLMKSSLYWYVEITSFYEAVICGAVYCKSHSMLIRHKGVRDFVSIQKFMGDI